MRSSWRTSLFAPFTRTSTPLRDIALVCLADGLVGASFGASAVAAGLPWWVPVLTSVVIFAGGSQIAAVGVAIAGGGPVAAVAAGALLNARMLPYGFAVADVTGRTWRTRLLGAHLTTDESVAFRLRYTDPGQARRAFWACGGLLFVSWNVAVALGVLAGATIRNTSALGLDATYPAVMLALALPSLRRPRARASAVSGAVVAVALTPVLPAGLPVLAGLGGVALAVPPSARRKLARALPGARKDRSRCR
ncbi:MAG TPA: AzlC family ABC transporter permease [Trebonia sp.]|nr:AzlC family ABC transporter permease [Trebonia sp.]